MKVIAGDDPSTNAYFQISIDEFANPPMIGLNAISFPIEISFYTGR